MEFLTTTKGQKDLPRYFNTAFEVARKLGEGRLDFVLPDGRRFRIEGAQPGPVAEITIHDNDIFARLIREDGLKGMTSNPTIFEKAIEGGGAYAEQIRACQEKGLSDEETFFELAIADRPDLETTIFASAVKAIAAEQSLIQAADQPRFTGVQSLEQLRQLRFGQQREWSDVAVYQAAGLPVVTGSSYEGLFHMLMLRRFDAFGRGVSEVGGELAHWRKQYPQMAIETELLLYYPLPVYFWFARTDEGRLRAQRVEEGMLALVANGTLDRLFTEEYAATIQQLGLDSRRTLRIANPHLSSNHPFDNAAYWFTPMP